MLGIIWNVRTFGDDGKIRLMRETIMDRNIDLLQFQEIMIDYNICHFTKFGID
jgi:hypothetical protein